MIHTQLTFLNKKLKENTMRVSKNSIAGQFMSIEFKDADTQQFVMYIPSFEISGYGDTKEEAFEMIQHSLDDFFDYLMHLSTEDRNMELSKLGWKVNRFKHKEFSRAYVDANGELRNFNPVLNTVREVALTA